MIAKRIYLAMLFGIAVLTLISCKNKRTRTCYLVDISCYDTTGVYREGGLFNRQAERQCEAEADRRDTLEQYFGSVHCCECEVGRE